MPRRGKDWSSTRQVIERGGPGTIPLIATRSARRFSDRHDSPSRVASRRDLAAARHDMRCGPVTAGTVRSRHVEEDACRSRRPAQEETSHSTGAGGA
jgi:hypothetical protein